MLVAVMTTYTIDVPGVAVAAVATDSVLAPDLVSEEEIINGYPFFLHEVTGGVSRPRWRFVPKVLTGSVRRRPLPDTLRMRKPGALVRPSGVTS